MREGRPFNPDDLAIALEQVLAPCKFEGISPQYTAENVDDALLNLFVKSECRCSAWRGGAEAGMKRW